MKTRLRIGSRVHPGERRAAVAACLTWFGVTTAHALLETARDALFLAGLPASQLPWTYLAIAVAAAVIASGRRLPGRSVLGRHDLAMLLLANAGVTALLWVLEPARSPWLLRAVYVWTGVNATITGLHFWLVLGERWTVGQAKRLYGLVATGGLVGGVAGAALARVLADVAGAEMLVLASAIALALTGLGPAVFVRSPGHAAPPPRLPIAASVRLVRTHPYTGALAGLALASTVAFTAIDFVFKSSVARAVPPQELGEFFASFYAIVNALALVAQVVATGWLLRIFGLPRVQWVLPVLLVVGSAGVVAGAGVLAAMLVKAVDGTLREVHHTTSELLLVPVPDDLRARAKPLFDIVARRGGQAVASLGILAATALPHAERWVAAAAVAACGAWIFAAARLHRPYLDLFRNALREGRLQEPTAHAPSDARGLETLFTALGSGDDREAIAAMDLLAGEGRSRLIPSFALYHPSDEVALHALALFERSGRRDFLPATDRLLSHPSAPLRAASLRVRTELAPDPELLRTAAADPSPLVRATAAVGLAALGERGAQADGAIESLLAGADPEAHLAVARALSHRPVRALDGVLRRLADSPYPEVAAQAARAMAASGDPRFLPVLLPLLAPHDVRPAAREAFLSFGDEGLAFLVSALANPTLPRGFRRHVPRTISRFAPERAGPALLARLLEEPDGMVRFKILRGLGRIVADHPAVELDRATLRRATELTLEAVFRLVYWRTILVEGAREVPSRATKGHELLEVLMRDKERHAIDRIFRLLALRFRDEDLESVHRGLESGNPRLRDSSRELLEHLLPRSWRGPILALVADGPDAERLAGAGRFFQPTALGYEALVAALLEVPSDTFRAFAAFHAGELGLKHLRGSIEHLRSERPAGLLERTTARALAALSSGPAEVAHVP